MNDLLNEDDFITEVPPANPWKVFGVFYAIGIVLFAITMIVVRSFRDQMNAEYLGAYIMLVPVVMTFVMVFYKKNLKISLKMLALAIFIMLIIFFIPLVFACYYKFNGTIAFGMFTIFIVIFIICCAMILPIIYSRQKRLNKVPL